MTNNKKFTLIIKIQEFDCPQTFTFENGVSGLEQLAIWQIVKNLADKKIQELLNSSPTQN